MPTMKEVPKEATIESHILMLRAGLIAKMGSGIYTYLPLGLRVMSKIEAILTEELELIGAQKVQMPHLIHSKLWQESGRYSKMGKGIFKLEDRHGVEHILGPTHEEVVVDSLKNYLQSYKRFPLNVFQITKKFRDEIRPRYGVMRGREFLMMDGYSFHTSKEDLENIYHLYKQAYLRFFSRIGLECFVVEADSGAMGGSKSEEFMVKSQIGDDTVFYCKKCSYLANQEKASFIEKSLNDPIEKKAFEKIKTPNIKTIQQLSSFFNISPHFILKAVVYQLTEQKWVLVLLRGSREINEEKLLSFLKIDTLIKAKSEDISHVLGEAGFLGSINIKKREKITIVLDKSINSKDVFIMGANEKDFHYQGVLASQVDFDFKEDISKAISGDLCPTCSNGKGILESFKGIEVGHIFQLGSFYSKAMKMFYLNEDGKKDYPLMGCYGIGIDRSFATVIEKHSDQKGIIFPLSIAPYSIIILILDKDLSEEAFNSYYNLKSLGYEVLIDDRMISAGIKMKDADLIGIPVRLTFGKYFIQDKKIGLKLRNQEQEELIFMKDLESSIKQLFDQYEKSQKSNLEAIDLLK